MSRFEKFKVYFLNNIKGLVILGWLVVLAIPLIIDKTWFGLYILAGMLVVILIAAWVRGQKVYPVDRNQRP